AAHALAFERLENRCLLSSGLESNLFAAIGPQAATDNPARAYAIVRPPQDTTFNVIRCGPEGFDTTTVAVMPQPPVALLAPHPEIAIDDPSGHPAADRLPDPQKVPLSAVSTTPNDPTGPQHLTDTHLAREPRDRVPGMVREPVGNHVLSERAV